MNASHNFLSIGKCLHISLLASMLALGGCQSKTPPTVNQNAQSAQNPPSGQSAPPGSAAPPSSAAPAPGTQTPPPPAVIDLPAGTHLHVRLDQDLGSKISHPGDSFAATVADGVVLNDQIIVPKGARAEGTVIRARPLGRFKGGAVLEVRLERVHTRWGSYPVASSTIERAERGKGRRTAEFAGGGGAFGALIGGIAGGGKGALIGALAGGGAGTAGSAFTGNREIFLPAETLLTFRLEHSVHITESQ